MPLNLISLLHKSRFDNKQINISYHLLSLIVHNYSLTTSYLYKISCTMNCIVLNFIAYCTIIFIMFIAIEC